MKTEYLKEFVTFIRLGSIGSAAAELQIPQSNLSRHLSDIEKEVGVDLFHRDSRYHLTPAGLVFFNGAARTLQELEAVLDECRAVKNDTHIPLSIQEISIRIPVFYDEFCGIILKLGKEHPEIDIENTTLSSYTSLDALKKKHVDVVQIPILKDAVTSRYITENESLISFPIATDTLSVWIDKRHELACMDKLTIEDLADVPIMTAISHITHSFETIVRELFATRERVPLFRYVEAESFTDYLLECGSTKDAVCILPTSSEIDVRIKAREDSRKMILIDNEKALETHCLVFSRDNENPGTLALRNLLEQES